MRLRLLTVSIMVLSLLLTLSVTSLVASNGRVQNLPVNPFVPGEDEFPDYFLGKRDEFGIPGGSYTVTTTSDPNTLNPAIATGDSASGQITDPIGLTAFTALVVTADNPDPALGGNVHYPLMAESFSVTGNKRFCFTLREGLSWNDGTPLTMDDWEWTYNVITQIDEENEDCNFHETFRSDALMVAGEYPEFQRIDENTFCLETKEEVGVDGYLVLFNDSFHPLPKHKLEAAALDCSIDKETTWGLDFACSNPGEVVGAGPYLLKSCVIGAEYVLERNPYYWMADPNGVQLPYFDEYRILIVENMDIELFKYLNGETDSLGPRPQDLSTIAASKTPTEQFEIDIDDPAATATTDFVILNQDVADPNLRVLFRDPRFREAISLASDRQGMIDSIFKGLAIPVWGTGGMAEYDITGRPGSGAITDLDPAMKEIIRREMSPKFVQDLDAGVPYINAKADPDFGRAQALLDEIGLKDTDNDGFREFPDQTMIVRGPNRVLDSVPAGDDVLLSHGGYLPGQADPRVGEQGVWIKVGPNGVLDTTPAGDDEVVAEFENPGEKVTIRFNTNVENSIRVDCITLLAEDYTTELGLDFIPDPIPFGQFVVDLLNIWYTGNLPEFEAGYIGISGGGDPNYALESTRSDGFIHSYRFSDQTVAPEELYAYQRVFDELFDEQAVILATCEATNLVNPGWTAVHTSALGVLACALTTEDERYQIVRDMQLILNIHQDFIYTVVQRALSSWRADRLANLVTKEFPDDYFTSLGFLERGYRVDLEE